MAKVPEPTQRELEILEVLWRRGEASVREVYEELRDSVSIVQNTVQAFLRTMEEKGLVRHRVEGRAFIYAAERPRDQTRRHMLGRVLDSVFDGAVVQLVDTLFSHRRPTREELERLETLIAQAKKSAEKEDRSGKKKGSRPRRSSK